MKRAVCLVCAGLLCPLTVVAQEMVPQDSTARQARDSARARLLPPIVITGTRVPTPVPSLGFAVSVLDSAALRREPLASGASALTHLQSTHIDEGAGVGGPTVLRLRGGEESFTQV